MLRVQGFDRNPVLVFGLPFGVEGLGLSVEDFGQEPSVALPSSPRHPYNILLSLRHGTYIVWSDECAASFQHIVFVDVQLPPYGY